MVNEFQKCNENKTQSSQRENELEAFRNFIAVVIFSNVYDRFRFRDFAGERNGGSRGCGERGGGGQSRVVQSARNHDVWGSVIGG